MKFKKAYIEITNICNLNCNFCPKNTREKKQMTLKEFEHIIKTIKPYTNYISPHLMGEPLLYKGLENIFEICYKNNMHVNLVTNGTLIKEKKDILLNAKSIRQISFSMHSFTSFSENDILSYTNNILEFINEIKSKEIYPYISFRFWNKKSLSEEKNIIILKQIKNNFIKEESLKDGSIKLDEKIFINFDEEFIWPINGNSKTKKGFCHGLRDHIGILVDGSVVPCCLDNNGTIKLGNIFKEDLNTILNSTRALNIYNGFSEGKVYEDLCKKCEFKNKFSKK